MAKKVIGDFDFFDDPGDIIDHITREQLSVDKIKAETDFLKLLEHLGIKVKRTGKNRMALCPFHDDHNPSLSITPDEKGFKCFSCGKSGDVVKFVEYYKGVKFKEALQYLSDFNGTTVKGVNENALKIIIDDIDGDNAGAVETQSITLNQIAEHYQKHLNDKALAYLKTRGLDNPELLSRFKIGFSDGSLIEKLSDGQQESLARNGILKQTKDGQYFESFSGHVVFPITDSNDQVVELYGRSISAKSSYPHLYQSGGHKGIFNCKATKVYDQIILTESIIDALSLIQLGFNNTTACFGTNGFTEHHLKAFKEGNVKTVIIAFDNDEAGRNAADKLKDQLLQDGFEVKVITPSILKDWNEELLNNISKTDIDQLINDAEVFKKEDPKKDFIHRRENKLDIFVINDITYKIGGAKETFVNNLRVSSTAERDNDFFPDTLDLCSHRSRLGFCAHLSDRFSLESKRIENDLLKILKYLQDQMLKKLSSFDENKTELTEAEREAGLAFLKSPDLFDQIISDTTTLGYVGDEINKLLLYICATSRLMEDPISVLIISQSASGKSYLVETIARLIPEDEVIDFNTVSKQALQYMGDRLLHKFMLMGEAMHDPEIEHQLREILSGHKLSRYVVMKNEKTGELSTEKVLVKAHVASVLTTTNNKVNPENASRYFIANTDESVNQTARIYEIQRDKYSEERELVKQNIIPQIITKHQSAQRLLQKMVIVFPQQMRQAIRFPDKIMRMRRDHQRFIDLIAAVCFLRQYQKETFNNGNFDYIVCDTVDYQVSYNILINGLLQSSISELPQQAVILYQQIREYVSETADIEGIKPEEVSFTQRQIREHTGLNQVYVKRYIKSLAEYEYLKVKGSGLRGSKAAYSLIADEDLTEIDLSIIPTPEEMEEILKI